MFSKHALLESDWYKQRLVTQQSRDASLWKRHIDALTAFDSDETHTDIALAMNIKGKLLKAKNKLDTIHNPDYIDSLKGTIGADPL